MIVRVGSGKRQVYKMYYGDTSGQKKQIIKGYIGDDNNKPRLFFAPGLDIDLNYVNELEFIEFYDNDTGGNADITYNKYAYFARYEDTNGLYINNRIRYAYINKNAYGLLGEPDYITTASFERIRFDKVENLSAAFAFLYWSIYSSPINISQLKYFNNVIDMSSCCEDSLVIGNPIFAPNAINMVNAYAQANKISGPIYIGENVTNASSAFENAGLNSGSSLTLNSCKIARYSSINLANCFRNCNISGKLYIYRYSGVNLSNIFRDRKSTKAINIFMPTTKNLDQLKTYLDSYKICNSSEIHTILKDEGCVDIQNKTGSSYKIKFFNTLQT